MERDTELSYLSGDVSNFNSHAHVERDQTKTENLDLKNNFNSHAHVERDALTSLLYHFTTLISTHTLTWSVTFLQVL